MRFRLGFRWSINGHSSSTTSLQYLSNAKVNAACWSAGSPCGQAMKIGELRRLAISYGLGIVKLLP